LTGDHRKRQAVIDGVEFDAAIDDGRALRQVLRERLDPQGKLVKGVPPQMADGVASRLSIDGAPELASLIEMMRPNEALCLSKLNDDVDDTCRVVTVEALRGRKRTPDIIARSGEFLQHDAAPAFVLLDFDTNGMPPIVRANIDKAGGFRKVLSSILPGLARAETVERASTSAGLYRTDTGQTLPGSDGVHVFVLVKDGSDAPRFLNALHQRCWLAGFGWFLVGASGQLLERSIVDKMVGGVERLVFEAPPILDPPKSFLLRGPMRLSNLTTAALSDAGPCGTGGSRPGMSM
jgi:hypothetical protein